MQHDLEQLGYVLEYNRVDTQDYLLPQRRNRIYATADVGNGQCAKSYHLAMQKTMDAMASDTQMNFNTFFDTSLPADELTTDRQQTKLKEALEAACLHSQTNNVFIDGSTSNSRSPEYAINVLTCVRPSHQIYSQKLQRWVTITEMWNAQGLFAANFANPQAVHEMLCRPNLAQSLAGNAFSSTVVQAKLIASMVHSNGWETILEGSSNVTVDDSYPASERYSRSASSSNFSVQDSSGDSISMCNVTTASSHRLCFTTDAKNSVLPCTFG